MPYRVIAIPTPIVESVRTDRVSPGYGHPVHAEIAGGYGPCRHCLRTFRVGEERRLLFTYDSFAGIETLPLPGPVFVHEEPCERHPEDGGFPEDLRTHALTLEAYARGRHLLREVHATNGTVEAEVERLLAETDADYLQVYDTEAGCFDFRIERIGVGDARRRP